MAPISDRDLQALCEQLALDAGAVIMEVFAGAIKVEEKADRSPVTEADRRAEAVILEGLRAVFPGLPCVGEEEAAAGLAPFDPGREFILVDALDGTHEFIRRGTDFTVNIALVRDGAPVLGVVYAPAGRRFVSASGGLAEALDLSPDGLAVGARRPLAVRPCAEPVVAAASRSHRTRETDDYIARYPRAETVAMGSSLKFCLLAAGEADLYPCFHPTHEWDTAAGDAILRAAGGMTFSADGRVLAYNKREADGAPFKNPSFIATGTAPLR